MTSKPLEKLKDRSASWSVNEIVLNTYKQRCLVLNAQRKEQILLKQHLFLINKKNESISKSLQGMKSNYEITKTDLKRRLVSINLASDKEKIVCRKKLDEFFMKKIKLEEQCRKLPTMYELEDLISENNHLLEQCCKMTSLLELTQRQYDEMIGNLISNFKTKVCEFCDIVIRLKLLSSN